MFHSNWRGLVVQDSLELLQERNPWVDKHPAGERSVRSEKEKRFSD